MLRSAATVDHSRLQSIERILLSTVEDLQRSHDARRVETTAEQDHATATKERKKARRQNHRNEQKSVLIEVRATHRVQQPPPNLHPAQHKCPRPPLSRGLCPRLPTQWFSKHELDPYPNGEEKLALARAAGLELRQVEHCAPAARASHPLL